MTDKHWGRRMRRDAGVGSKAPGMSVPGREMWSWPVLSGSGEPSGDTTTSRVSGNLGSPTTRGVSGGWADERLEVQTPGSFSATARLAAPGLLVWAGPEVTGRLDHLMDGHRVFLPYLMAGHFPAFSRDASPPVKLMVLPLLRSPVSGRVSVAVRVLDPWREFGVWVEPRHLAHRDCGVCTRVWAQRLSEFEAAQAELAAGVAAGGEEYVPILFAQADLVVDVDLGGGSGADPGDGTGLGWGRPRVIVHAHDVPAGPDSGDQDGQDGQDGQDERGVARFYYAAKAATASVSISSICFSCPES